MANVQKENDDIHVKNGNYTRIHNRILEELAKKQLSGYETRIIFALWRKIYGWRKKEDFISFKQFEKMTELPKSEISRTLSRLKKRNLVVENYNSGRRIYRFNKHFTTWKELEKSTTSCKNLQQELEKSTTSNVEIYNQKSPRQLKTEQQRAPKETLTKETYTKEMILSQINNLKSQFPQDIQPLVMEYIEIARNQNKTGKIGLNREKRLINELLTEWLAVETDDVLDDILRDDFKQALRITVENEAPHINYVKKVIKGLPDKRKVRLKKGYKKWK